MQLTKAVRNKLAEEFRIASDRMKGAADLQSKLYFFSSMFGVINRTFNEDWSNELALLHNVLQDTHRVRSGRLAAMTAGAQGPIQIPDEVAGKPTEVADGLASIITADIIDDCVVVDVLGNFATLAHSATGNGYYLYLKGDLKL